VEWTTDEEYERHLREELRWPELPIVEALEDLRSLRPGSVSGTRD
jgi:hypothetical protein